MNSFGTIITDSEVLSSPSLRPMSWLAVFRIARQISPYFDRDHYLSQTSDPEASERPVIHYIRSGADRGLDPAPDFSTSYYLESNADVKRSGVNPFWHYVRFGKSEGRETSPPVFNTDTNIDVVESNSEILTISDKFDVNFYRERYANLPESDEELVEHYLKIGWILGYDPCDWFSTRDYLIANPDVAEARINPFVHFALVGEIENRRLAIDVIDPVDIEYDLNVQAAELRVHFDEAFYLRSNPDVAEAGVDPVIHYLAEGHREGRDPHPDFSTSYYLESNPDLKEAGINPYLHFVRSGRAEGRYPKHPAGTKVDILTEFSDLDEIAKSWLRTDELSDLLSQDELSKILSAEIGLGRLILSFCHDDYLTVAGGIQLCVAKEVSLANEMGDSYLAISPWQPLPHLAKLEESQDVAVSLILNGKPIGLVRMSTLRDCVTELTASGMRSKTVVHQLLGHSIEQIIDLVSATGSSECCLWLHDFITVCPSYTLLRNNLGFCGAPDVESNACSVCIYGDERKVHQKRVERLFKNLDVRVLAPSTVAKKLWLDSTNLEPASIKVLPHVKLRWEPRSDQLSDDAFSTVKIAFVGTQVDYKGWSTFTALAKSEWPCETSFYYLGVGDATLHGIEQIPVHVKSDDPTAMTDALVKENIDFVIHWAGWPETFSFTTLEAIAAGAFVLTNSISGNVAATVNRTGHGVVLDDFDDLMTFLSGVDGRLKDVLERRRSLHRSQTALVIPSNLSFQKAGVGK